jgi:hypothetical protein
MIATLLVSCVIAAKTIPTVTPTPTPIRSEADYVAALSTVAAEYPQFKLAWIVTATATVAPTPNAEATCVAVGHRWVTDGSETAPQIIYHDNEFWKPMQWCRRCKLWREKP